MGLFAKWEFPKIRDTFLGVARIRTIVDCRLYWGPPFWETANHLIKVRLGELVTTCPANGSSAATPGTKPCCHENMLPILGSFRV